MVIRVDGDINQAIPGLYFIEPFLTQTGQRLCRRFVVSAELGEVSVSEDGEEWFTFPCMLEPEPQAQWHGCAGWTPTLVYDPFEHPQLDQEVTGGDAFDLSVVGLERAKYVKIRDLSTEGLAPSAGFDFDAIGVIHIER